MPWLAHRACRLQPPLLLSAGGTAAAVLLAARAAAWLGQKPAVTGLGSGPLTAAATALCRWLAVCLAWLFEDLSILKRRAARRCRLCSGPLAAAWLGLLKIYQS